MQLQLRALMKNVLSEGKGKDKDKQWSGDQARQKSTSKAKQN